MMDPSRRYPTNDPSTSQTPSPPYSNPRSSPSQLQPRSVPDLHGRARKRAELNRLQQEIRLLEDELVRLDILPPASEVCKELVELIESQNDPFVSKNSGLPQWDRWFRGPPAPPSNCFCCPTRR